MVGTVLIRIQLSQTRVRVRARAQTHGRICAREQGAPAFGRTWAGGGPAGGGPELAQADAQLGVAEGAAVVRVQRLGGGGGGV